MPEDTAAETFYSTNKNKDENNSPKNSQEFQFFLDHVSADN